MCWNRLKRISISLRISISRRVRKHLVAILKAELTVFDSKIERVEVLHGENRSGDIPHSLASIDKAKDILGYNPKFSLRDGLKEAVKWYWENLK
jgi:UDP-N-acetylglucosamine 4-epimerase